MNMPETTHESAWLSQESDADYICQRVVDTLLREDVRQCVSRGRIVATDEVPQSLAVAFSQDSGATQQYSGATQQYSGATQQYFGATQQWLLIEHFGTQQLWIPVSPCAYMQSWRLTRLPLLRSDTTGLAQLHGHEEILDSFRQGLSDEEAQGYRDFATECHAAIEHRKACIAEQRTWFAHWRGHKSPALGSDLPNWDQRLQHYDRLAAFQDHPYYPTARAKLGFSTADLLLYAPEFEPEFQLNWLAVPKALYVQQGTDLPPGWPGFTEVGLDASLAQTHSLVPVHPFVWQKELEQFLADSAFGAQCIRAPKSAMTVQPTLSVRTVALAAAPEWHIKVPLTIRTLGGRNIRTIKPGTIADGHRIQSLLAQIAQSENALRGLVLFTAEDTGAHVADQNFLGFILRRYPQQALAHATVLPVAALAAETPAGLSVVEEIANRFYDGDMGQFLDEYLQLTLQLHLTLWLRYGIALESNQQNSMLALDHRGPRLRLVLKDNDAARMDRAYLKQRWPALAAHVAELTDQRIVVEDTLPLAQMFTTITLQLNIAAIIEAIAACGQHQAPELYQQVRLHVARILASLEAQGENVGLARKLLLEDDKLYIKYLLVAATLVDKKTTGATDVNKFYGRSAPNFLRQIPDVS